MPKYKRKNRRSSSRRVKKRKPSSVTRGRGAKYTTKVPRALTNWKQLGFPDLVRRKLRVCYTEVIIPTFDATNQRWIGTLIYKCNGLMPPGDNTSGTARVPLHLDDYARVYTSYNVNSSKLTVRCFSAALNTGYVPEDVGGTPIPIGPAYVALRRRESQPIAFDTNKFSLTDCRTNGWRFIRIDPSGRTDDANYFSYARVQNGSALTSGYKAKYAKKQVDAGRQGSPHGAEITQNPSIVQWYQIFLCQPDDANQNSNVAVKNQSPTPVRCMVTIEYDVSFWRKRTLQPKDTVQGVVASAQLGQL